VGGKGGRKCKKEGKGGGGEKDGEEDGKRGSEKKRNGRGGEGQEEATLSLLWLLRTTHSVQYFASTVL